jgi:hypothetical protein
MPPFNHPQRPVRDPVIDDHTASIPRRSCGLFVSMGDSNQIADRAPPDRLLAQRLGSINAAAAELSTTWPSLRKAFTRHGLGMPTRKPEAARHAPSPPPATAAAN